MSPVAWKLDDNDDDPEELKKGKEKDQNSFTSVRRYARIPLKIIAAIATVYVCVLSSERYFYYWVQTTIERTDMHVSEIKFPAVTIIPMNFTSLDQSEEAGRYERLYNLVQSVIWQTPGAVRLTDENFTEFSDIGDLSLTSWGIAWQLNCQFFFTECQWRRKTVNCCDIFRPGKTFNGFAFVFNTQLAPDRDPTWPWSVAASGSLSGLNVKIKRKQNLYSVNSLGVIVHEPAQYLGMGIDYTSEDRIVVPVEPLRFTAEAGVRARPLEMRRCYFEGEISIKGKSRSECIYKCHYKYILDKCNCTINFPVGATLSEEDVTEAKDSTGSRLCGVQDLQCFNKHKLNLFSMSNIIEESRDNVFTTVDCGCFPQCDHTQYHTSTYTEKMSALTSHASEIEIDVYFQEETLFSYRSMLRFTLIDLMVSYGGIAGLIMGISVLGGVNAFLDRFACCRLPNGS